VCQPVTPNCHQFMDWDTNCIPSSGDTSEFLRRTNALAVNFSGSARGCVAPAGPPTNCEGQFDLNGDGQVSASDQSVGLRMINGIPCGASCRNAAWTITKDNDPMITTDTVTRFLLKDGAGQAIGGIVLTVEIDPTSPVTGSLYGREFDPVTNPACDYGGAAPKRDCYTAGEQKVLTMTSASLGIAGGTFLGAKSDDQATTTGWQTGPLAAAVRVTADAAGTIRLRFTVDTSAAGVIRGLQPGPWTLDYAAPPQPPDPP
jgi:hypothetical protein